jgi:hypothetical protein
MRILLASLFVLAACGGDDPDPHAVGACDGWLDNLGQPFTGMCEAACESPPVSTGESCDTVARLGCPSFAFGEDVEGCCIADGTTIRFYECQ